MLVAKFGDDPLYFALLSNGCSLAVTIVHCFHFWLFILLLLLLLIIIIIIIIIIELTHSKTILENSLKIKPQPA